MAFKEILAQLNFRAYCRKYNMSLWQCPQFLFLLMGTVIMISAVVTYFLGTRYVADPQVVSLIVLALTAILLIITFSVTNTLEGLAEANRLKTEFVNVVSHQLRAPISNLKWALEFILSGRCGDVNSQFNEYVQIIKDNTDRMRELVESLLMVSRIEQGRLPTHKIEFSLEEVVKKAMANFESKAKSAKVKVGLEILPEPLPLVLADPSQITVVVNNLLDNAIRYAKEGGNVKVIVKPKDQRYLLFSVEDDGVGIPQGDQQHIFQKFFRSGNALRQQTFGSGLGLYVAKSIIGNSKGKIGFVSEENKGSTFWFTIPIKV
jgi:signal transduction histidine kinase